MDPILSADGPDLTFKSLLFLVQVKHISRIVPRSIHNLLVLETTYSFLFGVIEQINIVSTTFSNIDK